jgi:hypothetical protein
VAAACTDVTLVEGGRVAYRGTPAALAALGESAGGAGDHPIARGYAAALRAHRAAAARTGRPAAAEGAVR